MEFLNQDDSISGIRRVSNMSALPINLTWPREKFRLWKSTSWKPSTKTEPNLRCSSLVDNSPSLRLNEALSNLAATEAATSWQSLPRVTQTSSKTISATKNTSLCLWFSDNSKIFSHYTNKWNIICEKTKKKLATYHIGRFAGESDREASTQDVIKAQRTEFQKLFPLQFNIKSSFQGRLILGVHLLQVMPYKIWKSVLRLLLYWIAYALPNNRRNIK